MKKAKDIILVIFITMLMIGCSRTFYVADTKFYQEQYLCTQDFRANDITRIEVAFENAGYDVRFEYMPMATYMILTSEMIEYTRPNGKGILKKRHVRRLKNTL